eukprot:SM000031S11570  [mRNA]  locus=s31:406190:409878:+ [translate_table: standard]
MLFCSRRGAARLEAAGHLSFPLCLLLAKASSDDLATPVAERSARTTALLRRLSELAASPRQRAAASHALGCALHGAAEYAAARRCFLAAAVEGHAYSRAGVARCAAAHGDAEAARAEIDNLIASTLRPAGWMHQERALLLAASAAAGGGAAVAERMADLDAASELDPTLKYPYKMCAALLMDAHDVPAAMAEMDRVLGFMVAPDLLELRAYFALAARDYGSAARDVRALLTLDPLHAMYDGHVGAAQLLRLLDHRVERWSLADCWLQLYERWSSVDDIGSLAVVHQMLEQDPCKGIAYFRQSLLLLRLNCPVGAMRSLRLARQHAASEHERLVYEGWILYDSGRRAEALRKAQASIALHRSFEAYFLKAYALADASLDPAAAASVVELLQWALKCPSDALRKGQALNNLGSVYVDIGKYHQAADCYINALKIRHTRAHQGLARVYALQGNKQAARAEMTRLIERSKSNAGAYEKRSEYCESREAILADLAHVRRIDPIRTYPYRYRAAVLMDSRQEAEALAELSRTITFKADLQLLHLRAAFHECMGDKELAIRDCHAALAIDPKHADTLELLNTRLLGRQTPTAAASG